MTIDTRIDAERNRLDSSISNINVTVLMVGIAIAALASVIGKKQ